MPRILAIETATKVCSAALIEGEDILGEMSLSIPHVHVERLVIMICDLLSNLHVTYGDLDAVAVSNGPGSFTGLRIGLSAAKGIAFAGDKKLIAIPTLDAIASGMRGFDEGRILVPILHARAEEFYYASFKFNGKELTLMKNYKSAEAADIAAEFSPGDKRASYPDSDVLFVGEGVQEFSRHRSVRAKFGEDSLKSSIASARHVAILAGQRIKRGDFANVRSLVPLYLNNFVAVKRNPLDKISSVKIGLEKN